MLSCLPFKIFRRKSEGFGKDRRMKQYIQRFSLKTSIDNMAKTIIFDLNFVSHATAVTETAQKLLQYTVLHSNNLFDSQKSPRIWSKYLIWENWYLPFFPQQIVTNISPIQKNSNKIIIPQLCLGEKLPEFIIELHISYPT